jgi:hypothetical protein
MTTDKTQVGYNVLEDIGMVTNKHEDFVLINDSESGIIMLGCEQSLNCFCSDVEIFADGTFELSQFLTTN